MDDDEAFAFIRRRMAEVGETVDDMTDDQLRAALPIPVERMAQAVGWGEHRPPES